MINYQEGIKFDNGVITVMIDEAGVREGDSIIKPFASQLDVSLEPVLYYPRATQFNGYSQAEIAGYYFNFRLNITFINKEQYQKLIKLKGRFNVEFLGTGRSYLCNVYVDNIRGEQQNNYTAELIFSTVDFYQSNELPDDNYVPPYVPTYGESEPISINDIFSIQNDGDYIYISGFYDTATSIASIYKFDRETLEIVGAYDSSIVYFESMHIDGDYIYAGISNGWVRKINKHTMIDEGSSFLSPERVTAIKSDADSIYIASYYGTICQKLSKADLSLQATSSSYGGALMDLEVDGDFVYIVGYGGKDIKKLNKSDLTLVSSSTPTFFDISSIHIDGDTIYIGSVSVGEGWSTDCFIKAYNKSDLSYKDKQYTAFGFTNRIFHIVTDDEYLYFCNQSIVRIKKSDFSYQGYVGDGSGSFTYQIRVDDYYLFYFAGGSNKVIRELKDNFII